MNKIYFLFILVFFSCNSSEKDRNTPDLPDYSGQVFTFVNVEDSNNSDTLNFYPEFIYFYNNTRFIFTYHEDFSHYFSSGTYLLKGDKIRMKLDEIRYQSYYPDIPATSAVDTNTYQPVIIQSPDRIKSLTIITTAKKDEIYMEYGSKRFFAFIDPKTTSKEIEDGLFLQDMDFLLK